MNMRVAIISPEVFPIPPSKGGAVENWLYTVAKLNREIPFCVFSVADGALLRSEQDDNIRHFRYKRSLLSNILLATYKLPFKRSSSFLYWCFYAFWCGRSCKREQAEIIHVFNRWQFIPIIRRLNPNARIILHIHQLSALNMNEKQSSKLRGMIDVYITCSRFMVQKIHEKTGDDVSKISLVANGANLDKFSPVDEQARTSLRSRYGFADEKIILYAGRLVENKGAHIVVEAFNSLNTSNVKLLIVGGNTYSDSTKTDYIKKLEKMASNKNKDIKFYGYVDQDELADLYKISNIFVLPSIVEEALSMSLVEAMASGLAVVGSNRGGISDLVEDGKGGFLIDEHDNVNTWAQRIKELLDDPALCQEFGSNARKMIENNFTWDKIAKDIKRLYIRVMSF